MQPDPQPTRPRSFMLALCCYGLIAASGIVVLGVLASVALSSAHWLVHLTLMIELVGTLILSAASAAGPALRWMLVREGGRGASRWDRMGAVVVAALIVAAVSPAAVVMGLLTGRLRQHLGGLGEGYRTLYRTMVEGDRDAV